MEPRSSGRCKAIRTLKHTHVLLRLVEEGCTAIVRTSSIVGTKEKINKLQKGDEVSVTWDDGLDYAAVFIVSGTERICEEEDDRLYEEENMEQEHGAEKETDDEEDKENDVHVPTDPQQPDRDGQDRRGRKRKLITKEQLRIANKETSSKKKNKASTCSSKKNKNKEINSEKNTSKSKKDEEVFIVRVGRSPLRTIPQNVINSTEDEIRKARLHSCTIPVDMY
ncbi:uncharacterized protein [Dysidea avara]|uniref:uncharacterized protein n=1 Tax=Dysidea avara TaxID=196820 RepID=UPI00332072B5